MTVLAGCVIRDGRGRILLLHRNTPELTWWELPGGKVEDGEDPQRAAIREIREETGLEATISHPISEATFVMSDGEEYSYQWFEAEIEKGEPKVMEPRKHDEVGYKDVFQMDAAELSPNVLNLLAYFVESNRDGR